MAGLGRAHDSERIDAPTHDPAVLAASLAHVAGVNRWLGGRRALRLALQPYLRPGLRVLDIGTGSADLPLALARAAARQGQQLDVLSTDRHPQMLAVAAARLAAADHARGGVIRLAGADALALPFRPGSFDVVLLSMVLHHLDDERAALALREAARVGRLVVVNELHRARANYLGARLLSLSLWRRNPLTRHDGPLSVLRAYRPAELRALAAAGGLEVLELRRRWFYRLVLVADRGGTG